jgi:hypothetical protein
MPATDNPQAEDYVDYYEQLIRQMVHFIETHTDRVFEPEKLKEAVRHSDRAGHYWKQIMGLRKHKPSPASFRNLAGEILPLVTALGKKGGLPIFTSSFTNPMKISFFKVLEKYKNDFALLTVLPSPDNRVMMTGRFMLWFRMRTVAASIISSRSASACRAIARCISLDAG